MVTREVRVGDIICCTNGDRPTYAKVRRIGDTKDCWGVWFDTIDEARKHTVSEGDYERYLNTDSINFQLMSNSLRDRLGDKI